MRFSGQISDFAIRSWLIHRTRLTALHFRSTGDTHLRLLPHTPSRADQRFTSLWPSRGAPQQRTCLIGVEFPLPGPQVWTFTSCSLLMPDTLLRPAGSPFMPLRRTHRRPDRVTWLECGAPNTAAAERTDWTTARQTCTPPRGLVTCRGEVKEEPAGRGTRVAARDQSSRLANTGP